MIPHITNYEKKLEVDFPLEMVVEAIKNSVGQKNSTDAYKEDYFDDVLHTYNIQHYKIGGYLLNISLTLIDNDGKTQISINCSSSSKCTMGHMQINTDQFLSIISAYLSGDKTKINQLKDQANKGCSLIIFIITISFLLTAYAGIRLII